jgi:nucleoside 2-deoxyribosyltransferase
VNQKPTIYLAGPEVFLPNSRSIGDLKKKICAEHGAEGLYPLDNEVTGDQPAVVSKLIFEGNCRMMDSADAIVANMTPFRGPGMDAGTAFEMAYMLKRGALVLGYTNVSGSYADRVRESPMAEAEAQADLLGLHIEDFGLTENLMLSWAVRQSGFDVLVRTGPPLTGRQIYEDVALFEQCVVAAVRAKRPPART